MIRQTMPKPPVPREPMPEHVRPMLARTSRFPRDQAGWAFEVKWDGVRAVSYWQEGQMRIESRNLNDIGLRYPELHALGRQLGARTAVLDGEIVALDERGKPSFERLQQRMHLSSTNAIARAMQATPVIYMIFDLLYLDDRLTTGLPYRERRELLAMLQLSGDAWQTPAYREGEGRELLAVTAEHGLEGILAKRLGSRYRPGERGREWLKVKNVNRQELVIGGWLEGNGRRAFQLGALLVGYYEGSGRVRALRYAGRVGTGFDEAELERLADALGARKRRDSPFAKHGVQPPRDAHFVKPELVAEIEFSHWTYQQILRHSVYKGLREDKAASEVRLEETEPAPEQTQAEAEPAPEQTQAEAEPAPQEAQAEAPEETLQASLGEASVQASAATPYTVLRETRRHAEIAVEGRTLRLSNREKILYPHTGFTKGEMIDYYAAVAPVLLPHLAERPLTLKRYPDGVEGEYFYEKRCPAHAPAWVQTAAIYSGRQEETIDYCLVEDLPTLLWTSNLATLELHTSLSCAGAPQMPTMLVFDLDPGPPAGLRQCCRVALLIKELLDTFALRTFVKTSGLKGLQVYMPLNTAVAYERTKPFAHAVARLLEKQHPRLVTSRMTKDLRPGKVLVDWSQNDPHKTTVCVYSLRASQRPTISTPLHWEEVEQGARRRGERELSVEPKQLLARVQRSGDLFAPLVSLAQSLPDLPVPLRKR
jgi:bifunctional non-homologous end joining protein LigD